MTNAFQDSNDNLLGGFVIRASLLIFCLFSICMYFLVFSLQWFVTLHYRRLKHSSLCYLPSWMIQPNKAHHCLSPPTYYNWNPAVSI